MNDVEGMNAVLAQFQPGDSAMEGLVSLARPLGVNEGLATSVWITTNLGAVNAVDGFSMDGIPMAWGSGTRA